MKISVFVRNEEQYQTVKRYPVSHIYSDDLSLVQKYPEIYYQMPRVKVDTLSCPLRVLVNNVGIMKEFYDHKEMIGDYFLNIANLSTIKLYSKYLKHMTLSIECSKEEVSLLKEMADKIEIFLYGRVEVMILKRHPAITKNGYSLQDREGHVYPTRVDGEGYVHIFHYEPLNRISEMSEYQKLGISFFRIDFFDESVNDIKQILEQVF